MDFRKIKGEGPERLEVEMLDPVMAASSPQAALAPITVSPSGLSCAAELYLGPDEATKVATSGLVAFTSTGLVQSVRLPITMPAAVGVAYHVYLDVYANGYPIVAYIATEDVIIPSGEVGPITWE